MPKNKNRNNQNSQDKGIEDVVDDNSEKNEDGIDFENFGVEENNEPEPFPEEDLPVSTTDVVPVVNKTELQPTNNIESKEQVMPTTEVKHQEVVPANPSAATTVVTPKRTATTRFQAVSKRYIELAKNGINTEEQKKEAVSIITDIVQLVTTSHDRTVFDACFSFFLSNRSIMLSPQTVIGNVTKYADQAKINRIVQFYVVFSSLVESKILRKRYNININHVRDIFNNKQFSEWLTDKR